jgi:hypothetical protein
MATKCGEWLFNFKEEFASPNSFIMFIAPMFENKYSIPHIEYIWICFATKSESHIM